MTSSGKKKKGTVDRGPILHQALWAKRLRLPVTEEEVAAAEQDVAGKKSELPSRLQDPLGFLAAPKELRLHVPARPAVRADVEEDMARAARDGREISADIEKKMQEDRANAESVAEDDEE